MSASIAAVVRFGFRPGQVVREIGHGTDADEPFRAEVEAVTGTAMTGGSTLRAPDILLVWWRGADGDLEDRLLSCAEAMAPRTRLWLLTPTAVRPGHLDGDRVAEATARAGLAIIGRVEVSGDWTAVGMRLPDR
ncbi:DUF3052 family protein [Nocardia sp. NPDC057353]|uniref:DUF3052 family protein n=1 Tax=Nocardia sp. NPDC057353 TaxID=3346104 RepID=UPI003632E16C